MITKKDGHPSWHLSSEQSDAYVSIQGGMVTVDYKIANRTISPYYVLPWWDEEGAASLDNLSQLLRGDFFCMPFGADIQDDGSILYHGKPAHGFWTLKEKYSDSSIILELDSDNGSMEKHIRLDGENSVLYQNHVISGVNGKTPMGYHPMLKLPLEAGSGMVKLSGFGKGFTTPALIEDSANGGYSRIKPGVEITDVTAVPCIDGSTLDLTRYPHPPGYEEIVMFINNPDDDFAYTSVAIPSEGYLYFQLKNPAKLRNTIMWMSNGGRRYAPWSGRVQGLLGFEEITAFFHYGKEESINENFLTKLGYPTCVELKAEESLSVPLISGITEIGPDYSGILTIEKNDDASIVILGNKGERNIVKCDLSYLQD
jgi:hypothetical protein